MGRIRMAGIDIGFGQVRLAVAALVLSAAVGGFAQEAKTSVVLPPAPLLPAKFGPWVMAGSATVVGGGDAVQVDAANATSLKEFGIDRYAVATYTPEHGSGSIEVKALQFGDATGAAAAFTFYRRPGAGGVAAGGEGGGEGAGVG